MSEANTEQPHLQESLKLSKLLLNTLREAGYRVTGFSITTTAGELSVTHSFTFEPSADGDQTETP